MSERGVPFTPEQWNERGAEYLFGHLGIHFESIEREEVRARLTVAKHLCAPNGFLHAGTVVSLADSCCGAATVANLPEGAAGFTTIELKANFLGTALEGELTCVARPLHRGRTTQVWDAEVVSEASGRTIAVFRCSQMVLWPREG